MKTWIFAAVIAGGSLAASGLSAQQRGFSPSNPPPDLWCMDTSSGNSAWQVCSAYTFEQCMASRYSHTDRCYLNPRYDPRFQRR